MKIEIKPLVRPVYLREYAEEYGDEAIWVWVNPPRLLRLEHWDIVKDFQAVVDDRTALIEALEEGAEPDADAVASLDQQIEELSRRLYGWFAKLWSKHDDADTHWTAGDVEGMVEACLDSDPRLWDWVQDRHWELVREHREGVKKK